MKISLIVAVSRNGVIGKDNKLPWHLPEDLKRFKALTMGHPIIMGRKTFESIGKPLPGRTNIVITHQKNFAYYGATTTPSLDEALRMTEKEGEVFVIGGAQVFKHALPAADKLYLTLIDRDVEGDTFFRWAPSEWQEISRENFLTATLPYSFITYERK